MRPRKYKKQAPPSFTAPRHASVEQWLDEQELKRLEQNRKFNDLGAYYGRVSYDTPGD